MAEFCRDCAKRILKLPKSTANSAIYTFEPDICEGCGQFKPVLVELYPTLGEQISYRIQLAIRKKRKKK